MGHDIDLWTNNVAGFRIELIKAINKSGNQVLIDNKTNNGCNVVFFKREDEALTFMKIDVMTDTSWKSLLTLVDKETMAECIQPYKNFFVMGPEVEALGHFLYPMFEWGFIKKEQYKVDIKKYCHSKVFISTFKKLWGKTTANQVLKMIEEERWDDIYKQMGLLKKKALLRGMLRRQTWMNFCKTLYYILYRRLKPSGKCLAFCGLDGAGKTTILDELNKIFVGLLKNKKVYYGY